MRSIARQCLPALLLIATQLASGSAAAQQVTGSLVDLVNSGRFDFNRLEVQAALANQAAYNELAPLCDDRAQGTTCNEDAFRVFSNVRELVQSANELLGSGPTQYSLGLDEEGIGFALRWTAAEELAAQSAAGKEFANNQLTSLMSRMTAVRYGARGFNIVGLGPRTDKDQQLASQQKQSSGGGASADVPDDFSRWGGFLDASYGWGDRDPSQVEDAFDFDGTEVTAGVDYRLNSKLVLGGIFGYSDQLIDFDSRRSVVDGNIESNGYSVIAYGMYEWGGPYMSASLGWQRLSMDVTRRITYPSFNPDVESIDVTARGDTNSSTVSATFSTGWSLAAKAFGFEPYVRAEYRDMTLDGFRESSVHNSGSRVGEAAGFDFAYNDQDIKSLDAAAGFRLQYVLTPPFGVLVPYLKAEYHKQFENDPNSVRAAYNADVNNALRFDVVGEKLDSTFAIYAVGVSAVVRGGWQAFIQYQTVQSLDLLSNDVITGGVRSEF